MSSSSFSSLLLSCSGCLGCLGCMDCMDCMDCLGCLGCSFCSFCGAFFFRTTVATRTVGFGVGGYSVVTVFCGGMGGFVGVAVCIGTAVGRVVVVGGWVAMEHTLAVGILELGME